jgi:integrase
VETTRHVVFVYEPRKLLRALSSEEVLRLLEAAPGPKHKRRSALPSLGLRAMEVVALKVCDIDSKPGVPARGRSILSEKDNPRRLAEADVRSRCGSSRVPPGEA